MSNSIPFLLALSGENLDHDTFEYEKYFCSILDGIDEYDQIIPLANREKMYQIFCSNIIIDSEYNINIISKKKHRNFENYDDYYDSLLKVLKKIRDNAVNENRQIKYGIVTTISSGYDSAACAAVAKELGCNCAMTLGGVKYRDDSGEQIAKMLGYKDICIIDVEKYKIAYKDIDALCLANGEQGSQLEFSVFFKLMQNNIVFIGINGDHAYGIDTNVKDDYIRDKTFPYYQACLSHVEPSLFNGHINIPMPIWIIYIYIYS